MFDETKKKKNVQNENENIIFGIIYHHCTLHFVEYKENIFAIGPAMPKVLFSDFCQ